MPSCCSSQKLRHRLEVPRSRDEVTGARERRARRGRQCELFPQRLDVSQGKKQGQSAMPLTFRRDNGLKVATTTPSADFLTNTTDLFQVYSCSKAFVILDSSG